MRKEITQLLTQEKPILAHCHCWRESMFRVYHRIIAKNVNHQAIYSHFHSAFFSFAVWSDEGRKMERKRMYFAFSRKISLKRNGRVVLLKIYFLGLKLSSNAWTTLGLIKRLRGGFRYEIVISWMVHYSPLKRFIKWN